MTRTVGRSLRNVAICYHRNSVLHLYSFRLPFCFLLIRLKSSFSAKIGNTLILVWTRQVSEWNRTVYIVRREGIHQRRSCIRNRSMAPQIIHYLFFIVTSFDRSFSLELQSYFSNFWKEVSSAVCIPHNFRFTKNTKSRSTGSEMDWMFLTVNFIKFELTWQ